MEIELPADSGVSSLQVYRRVGEPGGTSGRRVSDHRDPAGLSGTQQLQRRFGGRQRHEFLAGLQTGPHLRGTNTTNTKSCTRYCPQYDIQYCTQYCS